MYTPEIDACIDSVGRGVQRSALPEPFAGRVLQVMRQLERLEPTLQGSDRLWSFWVRSERGPIEAFGNFNDWLDAGEVASNAEFEQRWLDDYPTSIGWHRQTCVRVAARLFVFVGRRGEIELDPVSATISGADLSTEAGESLISWILNAVTSEVDRILADPSAYERELEEALPMTKRWGRVRRRRVWELTPDVERFHEVVGRERTNRFRDLVARMGVARGLPEMTLGAFLRFCEIAYDANEYDLGAASARDKYIRMADGRTDGLLDLSPDDPEAFARWYEERPHGGHPWEICRGGNRTHISLHVVRADATWSLYLAGFSAARLVETVRMALALDAAGVPFTLHNGPAMLRMLTGEDDVGIVPDDVSLGSAGPFLPEEHIVSFAHLSELAALSQALVERVSWVPLAPLRPVVPLGAGGASV